MKKRESAVPEGTLSAGGGGGGWMGKAGKSVRSVDPLTDRAAGQVQRSIEDAGGYPTRGGVPMKTRMQERMDARKAKSDAEREANPPPTSQESWEKFKAKNKIKGKGPLNFRKGGKVGCK